MGLQDDVLRALAQGEVAGSTKELADGLRASEGSIRSALSRLKKKGFVHGSGDEGWSVTDAGRKQAETGIEIAPDLEDIEATDRGKLAQFGRMAGIDAPTVQAATELILAGDPANLVYVWEAMTNAGITIDRRRVFWNLWRSHQKGAIPPEIKEEIAPDKEEVEVVSQGKPSPRVQGRDYIIMDGMPVRVGENLGDYTLQDAKDLIALETIRSRFKAAAQPTAPPWQPPQPQPGEATTEKVSEILGALAPYIGKQGGEVDWNAIRDLLETKLEVQRGELKQEIAAALAAQGAHRPENPPPKTFGEQISEILGAVRGLSEVGPAFRMILGIPEQPQPSSPPTMVPVDGQGNMIPLDAARQWQDMQLNMVDHQRRWARDDENQKLKRDLIESIRKGVQNMGPAMAVAAAKLREGREDVRRGRRPAWGQCPNPECQARIEIPSGATTVTCPKCGMVNEVD